MAGSKKRVLIINDDEIFINVYANAFIKAGFEVETASDGKSGLTKIIMTKPDLVLLGLMLSVMNGFDILKVVKEKETTKEIPMIVCSHLTAPGTIEETDAREMGAIAVFYKGACTPEIVIAEANKVLLKPDRLSEQPREDSS